MVISRGADFLGEIREKLRIDRSKKHRRSFTNPGLGFWLSCGKQRLLKAYYSSGTCILPSKTLSRGQLENPAYTPRGETTCPSANIPARQHERGGSGRRFNRKGPGASSKSENLTFRVRSFSRGYAICDDMLLLDHATRPRRVCFPLRNLHPPTARITQSMEEESDWESPPRGQRNPLR